MNCNVFKFGKKGYDFIVHNPLKIEFTDDDLILCPCELKENKLFDMLKSYTWSTDCRFLFIVTENFIIITDTMSNEGFISNITWKLFETYLDFK